MNLISGRSISLIILIGFVAVALGACDQKRLFKKENVDFGDNGSAGHYVSLRGFKMYYEEYGKGDALVMIHGNNGSIESFRENIPFFAKKYKVIATDSRSQGKSADPSDSLSFEMMADDEAVLLDSLHIDSAFIIGWSDGGIVAIEMALRHPRRIRKMAISGANLWPDSTAINPQEWLQSRNYFDSSENKHWLSAREKNEWKLFMLDWVQPHIPLDALHSIKTPAMVIAGDNDIILDQHTRQIAANIPLAQLWIVPHSGHGTLTEHAPAFNEKVDSFFSSSR